MDRVIGKLLDMVRREWFGGRSTIDQLIMPCPVWGPPMHRAPPLQIYSGRNFDTMSVLREKRSDSSHHQGPSQRGIDESIGTGRGDV